jgi:hypothetical protein
MRNSDVESGDREAAILLYAEMIAEAQALGAALLDHDADDAWSRAAHIASLARSRELTGVALIAEDLTYRLEQRRNRLGVGVGGAYEQLMGALEHLLDDAEARGPSKKA